MAESAVYIVRGIEDPSAVKAYYHRFGESEIALEKAIDDFGVHLDHWTRTGPDTYLYQGDYPCRWASWVKRGFVLEKIDMEEVY